MVEILKKTLLFSLSSLLLLSSCGTANRGFASYTAERIELDSASIGVRDTLTASIINSYKPLLDEKMQEVVAISDVEMSGKRPESILANFTTEALMSYTDNVMGESVDFAMTNFGGLRAVLPKGKVKRYDIFSIYPFENYLVIVNLSGKLVKDLFEGMAKYRVEALSKQVNLSIKDQNLVSVQISGKEIDPNKIYKIATLDFLADGGDQLSVLKQAEYVKNTGVLLRDVMFEYISSQMASQGYIHQDLIGNVKVE